MKLKYTKFGLAQNPVGAQVKLDYQGRTLLGDVTGFYRNDTTSTTHLTVRHFNGEPWPIEPVAIAVDILEPRHYERCQHCERAIILDGGIWVDPEATGDDSIWRETCDAHDTFTAEHEPEEES